MGSYIASLRSFFAVIYEHLFSTTNRYNYLSDITAMHTGNNSLHSVCPSIDFMLCFTG